MAGENIVKGMVLAAGLGTRMGPISDFVAKPAVPFMGVPMIEHSIGVLRSGGIEEIIINVHHLPETIKDLLGDGSQLDVKISYSYEETLLGSGGGIGKARSFFEDEPFVVINSDIIVDVDLKKVIESHLKSEASATLVLREDPEERYGKVLVDETGRIRKIEGHPKRLDFHGGQAYMFAGVHVIEPVWFDYAPDRAIYESFPDVYAPMMLDNNAVNAYIYDGRWIDIGSAKRFLESSLDQLIGNILPNKLHQECDCTIRNSILSEETVIGKGVTLEGVIFIGAASVGEESSLTECIVCPGAEIPPKTEARRRVFFNDSSVALSDIRD
jgi:mannose-1-phosphate guanylyltransferase